LAVLRRFLNKPANFSWMIERKLAGSARPESETQLRWLRNKGIRAIVCLNKERPLDPEEVKSLGFEYAFIPVQDFTAPSLADIMQFVSFTDGMLGQNKPVVVCCGAGIGRTGTMLAAYLVRQCHSAEEAMEQVKEKRGYGVEFYEQKEALFEYAHQMGKCQKQPI
jgi:atypical dual specificity phosphatase